MQSDIVNAGICCKLIVYCICRICMKKNSLFLRKKVSLTNQFHIPNRLCLHNLNGIKLKKWRAKQLMWN